MSGDYYQIIYVSAASEHFDESGLPELLKNARATNEKLGITGMLLFHQRSFIQVITGPERAVRALYAKVEQDPRHTSARVLFQGPVDQRSFDDWSMGFYQTGANSADELPGFNRVLTQGFNGGEDEPDRARAVLEAFRGGRWRQSVDV